MDPALNLPNDQPDDDDQPTKPKRKYEHVKRPEARLKHPGVAIFAVPGGKSGRDWDIRWLEDGKQRRERHRDRSYTEVEDVALKIWLRLREEKRRVRDRRFEARRDGKDPDAIDTKQYRIADACARHARRLRDENMSHSYQRAGHEACVFFLAWCRDRSVHFLDQLTPDVLEAFNAYMRKRRMLIGGRLEPYAVSTVNQQIKPVRTMLRHELALGRVPRLTDAMLRKLIPHIYVNTPEQREAHGVVSARRLEVEDIRLLLAAARRRDAARPDVPPCTGDFCMLLLFGLRRDEYVRAKVADVRRSAKLGPYIAVLGKGRRKRKVQAKGWLDPEIGGAILQAMTAGRAPAEWLSHLDYEGLATVLTQLQRDHGAPSCKLHDLRATTATYQLGIASMNPQLGARRLGHRLEENDLTYIHDDLPDGMRVGSATLEHSMASPKAFARALASMRGYAELPARMGKRKSRRPIYSEALLHDDAAELERALAQVKV
jgi:integrase